MLTRKKSSFSLLGTENYILRHGAKSVELGPKKNAGNPNEGGHTKNPHTTADSRWLAQA